MSSERYGMLSRILDILNLLEKTPTGLTSKEIFDRLKDRHSVDKRTFYRDLECLEYVAFLEPRDESLGRDDGGWRWKVARHLKASQALLLNQRELAALYISRGMLEPLRETPFYADIQNVFHRIEATLGKDALERLGELSQELHFAPYPRLGLGVDAAVLDTLHAACREQKVVKGRYVSVNAGAQERERAIGPHFLYFARGSVYLVGEDLESGQIKTFALPRFKSAVMTAEPYAGDSVSPDQFFHHAFGVFRGDQAVSVKLEFSPPVAEYIRERSWHASQRTVCRENGRVELSLEVSLTPELVQWILGFGHHVRVLGPDHLRDEVVRAAQEVLALYSRPRAA